MYGTSCLLGSTSGNYRRKQDAVREAIHQGRTRYVDDKTESNVSSEDLRREVVLSGTGNFRLKRRILFYRKISIINVCW
jgi:hypothetical protein